MAETDGVARAKLLEGLRAGASISAAAKAAGYSRQHVYRLGELDSEVGEVLRAVKAKPGKGRRAPTPANALAVLEEVEVAPVRPHVAPVATVERPQGIATEVAEAAPEAVARLRRILELDDPDPRVLAVQCKAAQIVLDVAGRPAPVGALRVRAEDGERAVEAEASGGGLESLLARIIPPKV